jgi:hypothetical protein
MPLHFTALRLTLSSRCNRKPSKSATNVLAGLRGENALHHYPLCHTPKANKPRVILSLISQLQLHAHDNSTNPAFVLQTLLSTPLPMPWRTRQDSDSSTSANWIDNTTLEPFATVLGYIILQVAECIDSNRFELARVSQMVSSDRVRTSLIVLKLCSFSGSSLGCGGSAVV